LSSFPSAALIVNTLIESPCSLPTIRCQPSSVMAKSRGKRNVAAAGLELDAGQAAGVGVHGVDGDVVVDAVRGVGERAGGWTRIWPAPRSLTPAGTLLTVSRVVRRPVSAS
jgi:hypothetical protein